jgi:hypothetical protein
VQGGLAVKPAQAFAMDAAIRAGSSTGLVQRHFRKGEGTGMSKQLWAPPRLACLRVLGPRPHLWLLFGLLHCG